MYVVPVSIMESSIDGEGVFTDKAITEGSMVWKFESDYDFTLSQEEYDALSPEAKEKLKRVAYFSPWTGQWVYPPEGDAAEFTNHSSGNNLSVVFNQTVSPEPYFVANRDIEAGEELTNNYYEFDAITQKENPRWAKK